MEIGSYEPIIQSTDEKGRFFSGSVTCGTHNRNPSTGRERQKDHCRFKASPIYIVRYSGEGVEEGEVEEGEREVREGERNRETGRRQRGEERDKTDTQR